MVAEIDTMEFIVVENEAKALLLENELIKQLSPRFNILLKDDKGYMMSLVHYCEAFEIELATPAHDPVSDSLNLAHLYNAFLTDKDYVQEKYKNILVSNHKLPEPIYAILQRLAKGETITPAIFDEEVRKELD